jgi:tetratricopeptide (TPR) repeat protein
MTAIDPENPVVKLCAAGIRAEEAGDGERAAALYREAWDARSDEFEASMAAHYLARVQPDAGERMRWNELALGFARAAGDAAAAFLPSLYLNIGHSHEEAGRPAEALAAYEMASSSLDDLEPTLADSLRAIVTRALERVRPERADRPLRG